MQRSSDVLPAPLGPRIASVSAARTKSETPSKRRSNVKFVVESVSADADVLRDEPSADLRVVDVDMGAAVDVGK